MPRLVCRFIYVECHVLVVTSLQSDQLYAYLSTSFCMLYVQSHMPVAVCLHLYAGTWVPSSSLWVAKLAYMSNWYISVYMPNALFRILYTKCNGLYAKLHMLDWNMPNAMTIAMSFRMTTEHVGCFVIYIYISINRLWLSILPLQEEIAIIPPGLQFISQCPRYFSMPAYHGKEQNFSIPAYIIFCILAGIFYVPASISLYPGQHISRSQVSGISVC
jgi:hypothetical protein